MVYKFFPHLQIDCHNGGMDFLSSGCGSWLPTPHAGASAVTMVSDQATPVILRLVECHRLGKHRLSLASMIENNDLRQRCERLGSESLQISKASPTSDILLAVNDIVEPYVRSLCGSSDHLSPLSRHQGRSVRRTQRGAGGDL